MKTTKKKIALDGLNSRLVTAEEKIMNIKTTVETQQDETERNKIWKKKMNRASVSSGITSGGLVNVSVGFRKERKEKRGHEKFWRKSGWKLFKFDENHEQDTRNPMDPRQRCLIFPMPGSQLAYDQCLINEWANCRLCRLSPCCLLSSPFFLSPLVLQVLLIWQSCPGCIWWPLPKPLDLKSRN